MQRDLQPVGDVLASYEATAMPTDTLDRLGEEALESIRVSPTNRNVRQNAQVLGWLLRIALHKIKALEGR